MNAIYRFGRFELRPATRQVLVDNQPAALGARAFDVLLALIERRDRLVTKNELLDLVWPGLVVEENNLQVQISALRKLLGADAIATVAGHGYRFTLDLADAGPAAPQVLPSIDDHTPSIAVLPFVNLSDDAANEYFAEGLAEELLNVLSKIRDIRVVSRTSSFYFRGKDVDLATVARKLNVATVLEGSVRKDGNRVRIAVKLVKVTDGCQLWSERYDRTLEHIFAVQDDIAQSVVTELRSALLGKTEGSPANGNVKSEVMAAVKGRATNPEAHRLYLLARHLLDRHTRDDVAKALGYLKEALALDPGFAVAWAELGRAYGAEADRGWAPVTDGFRRMLEAVVRALALDPDLAEAHGLMGWLRMVYRWDWRGAEDSYRRALELASENAGVLRGASVLAQSAGRLGEAIELIRRSLVQDPLSGNGYHELGLYLNATGRFAEAEAAWQMSIEVAPQRPNTRANRSINLLALDRGDEALAEALREPDEAARLFALAIIHYGTGLQRQSDAELHELIDKYNMGMACQVAQVYAWRGEVDLAFEWLERAYVQRDGGLAIMRTDPLFRALRSDPRWDAFLRKMGLDHFG